MLSLQQQRRDHMSLLKATTEPMRTTTFPPAGPEPLVLTRQEVDALYDLLQVVLLTLAELKIEYIPIKSSLLGAVRSQSILFNEKKGISIAILRSTSDEPSRLKAHLLHLMRNLQAANPQQSHETSNGFMLQENPSCDRIQSMASPRIGIDIYVLSKYETLQDILKVTKESGGSVGSAIPTSAFPLYHYDSSEAIAQKPLEYFSFAEVRPLRMVPFGALEVLCPFDCIGPLDRFYGEDWSTHYYTGAVPQPLLEDHYYPMQHSQLNLRIWSDHSRTVLEQAIDLYREGHPQEPIATPSISLARTRSVFALGHSKNRVNDISPSSIADPPLPTKYFGNDVRRHLGDCPDAPIFDKDLRAVMEPHLRKARRKREECRKATDVMVDASIAGSVGVPYTALRDERRFLFDEHSHPLHEILAETLGVEDLSQLHKHYIQDKRALLAPLLTEAGRYKFQECYDNFVTSFCIPLVHALALTKKQFTSQTSKGVTYRYQAFPCVRVVRPGEFSIGPHCDTAYGHSIANLNFHVPLTQVSGTNSLFIESFPGKEDWHPLTTKAPGLGFLFDGARCLHFTLENTTEVTRVSIDFRIALYSDDGLCSKELLVDRFSTAGPGYYDEAFVAMDACSGGALVAKKRAGSLLAPDHRVGFPFA